MNNDILPKAQADLCSQSSSASSVPTPTPGASNSSLPHGLMNDTSVAIVASDNGDKHLLFQENSGTIRQALYDSPNKQWTSDVNNIVATNAKNDTPIVAFLPNSTNSSGADLGATVSLISCGLGIRLNHGRSGSFTLPRATNWQVDSLFPERGLQETISPQPIHLPSLSRLRTTQGRSPSHQQLTPRERGSFMWRKMGLLSL